MKKDAKAKRAKNTTWEYTTAKAAAAPKEPNAQPLTAKTNVAAAKANDTAKKPKSMKPLTTL